MIADEGCAERGCPMHDNRETPGVVMVSKREFVGLTDEEIEKVWNGIGYSKPWSEYRIVVSRAIEAKLKEKNHVN